jgi:glycosyltransferase 2 family protein
VLRIGRLRRWRQTLLRVAGAGTVVLSFALLGGYVARNWSDFRALTVQPDYLLLGAACILYTGTYIALALMWHSLMSAICGVGDRRLNLRVYALSAIAKRIPGTIWYVVGRTALYSERAVPKSLTVSATVLEAVLVVVAGLPIALLGVTRYLQVPVAGAYLDLTVTAIIVLALVSPWLAVRGIHLVARWRGVSEMPSLGLARILTWLAGFTSIWLLGGLTLFATCLAVYRIPVDSLPSVLAAWAIAGLLGNVALFVPSGLGVREVGLTLLLGQVIPVPLAVVVALVFRIMLTGGEVVCSLVTVMITGGVFGRSNPTPAAASSDGIEHG